MDHEAVTPAPPAPSRASDIAVPAPETPAIQDRYQLLYLLNEAAELEHGACCAYLFAAWSLKTDPAEGLPPERVAMVAAWKATIEHIAVQEMMHLALVTNLLTALGGAPHLDRPNFPQRSLYAPEIQLALTPITEQTLERFLYFERPEGLDLSDLARDVDVSGPRVPSVIGPGIVPAPQDFSSIGQLYRGIERGLHHLADRYGEAQLFVGAPRAQATRRYFRFPAQLPELISVSDLASAQRAIETIVEEGEGARGAWQDAHFGRFVTMLKEYRALRAENPTCTPARPVLENPYAQMPPGITDDMVHVHVIDDPSTAAVIDLFNACYAAMLQLQHRFFMHSAESDAELAILSQASVGLMGRVLRPLGELLTMLPAGPRYPGMTAGANFQATRRVHVTTHKAAAWAVLRERLAEVAAACGALAEQPGAPPQLGAARRSLEELSAALVPSTARTTAAMQGRTDGLNGGDSKTGETPMSTSSSGGMLSFERDIKPLFRDEDRRAMNWRFDLWDYGAVSAHAEAILGKVEAGAMPCDSAWPADRVAMFRQWIAVGKPR